MTDATAKLLGACLIGSGAIVFVAAALPSVKPSALPAALAAAR